MRHEYQGIIFTDHALKRLKRRKISQAMVAKAVKSPQSREKEDNGNTRFVRVVDSRNLHVIARYLPDERKWLIVSAWVRGEDDARPIWMRVLLAPVTIIQRLMGRGK